MKWSEDGRERLRNGAKWKAQARHVLVLCGEARAGTEQNEVRTARQAERTERSETGNTTTKEAAVEASISLRLCRFGHGVVRRSLPVRAAERDERTGASEATRKHTTRSPGVCVKSAPRGTKRAADQREGGFDLLVFCAALCRAKSAGSGRRGTVPTSALLPAVSAGDCRP